MPTRTALASWQGPLQEGYGKMKLGSGAWEGSFSYATRMGDEAGTNPEELIAAAHAACFSMALEKQIENAGYGPATIETQAEIDFAPSNESHAIERTRLRTRVRVDGIADGELEDLAMKAKGSCAVSKALWSVAIDLEVSRA